MSFVYIVYFTAVGAFWPYLPVYFRSLQLDLATIGVLAAVGAATQLVASPLWGALTDRFARTRLTLPAAALVATAGALLLIGARGLPTIAAAVLVLSTGLAGIGPVLDGRAVETLGSERIRYGQVRAWGSVAFVVSALLVGGLLERHGTAALFAVYIPSLLLTALISLSLARRPAGTPVRIVRGAWSLIRERGMVLFLIGSLLVWTILTAVNAFYSIQIVALGGPSGTTGTVGLSWAVGAFVEIPIMWSFSRLAGLVGTERLLVLGAALFAARAASAAMASDPMMLVAIAPLEGAAFGLFFVGGVSFMATRAPVGLAATAQGVFTAMGGLAQILGAGIGGYVADALTIPGLFATGAVAAGLATVVVALAVRTRPIPVADRTSPVGLISEEVPP